MLISGVAISLCLASSTAAATIIAAGGANQDQLPLQRTTHRNLHGRFLHITDFHPDPFYVEGADPAQKCHRGKGEAGHWGAEATGCDTPWSLVNATFQWIDENIKDKVDFVVWTGDSARHDNDEKIPRTPKQIYDLNKRVVKRFMDVFRKKDHDDQDDPRDELIVPVIPTLGNNDIFPHNIMLPGPSKTTREYADIWKHFVPEDQFHVFEKGAYFWTHVVLGPNGQYGAHGDGGLAVFSLNTLYFFDSNKAVDGCKLHTEPGFQQMDWLDVQLELMRDRGMKAILIGHVPPARTSTKQSWDDTCWKKYVRLTRKYRDVIVGHIYGHMNLDHFFLLDSHEAEKKNGKNGKNGGKSSLANAFHQKSETCMVADFDPEENPATSIQSAETYLQSLREGFASVPGVGPSGDFEENTKLIGGKWGERYAVTLVGPSVVPNYFPTMRIIEYNTTGFLDVDAEIQNKPTKRTHTPGPAYSMQPFTWIGYTQYFANLTKYNAQGRKSIIEYEVEYDTLTDKTYQLKDLTVKSYLALARKIVDATSVGTNTTAVDADGKKKDKKKKDKKKKNKKNKKKKKKKKKKQHKERDHIWHTFVKRAFVGTVDQDVIDEYRAAADECT